MLQSYAVIKKVSVRQLNQQTSAVLAEVAQGQTVTITKAGRPIARIVPLSAEDAFIDSLVEQGLVTPATWTGPIPLPPDDGTSHINLSDEIVRERRESPW